MVGSMLEWLERRDYHKHGLGTKPTPAILLCFRERHFTAFSPALWSWQAANCKSYLYKISFGQQCLVISGSSLCKCLPYILAPPSLFIKSGGYI